MSLIVSEETAAPVAYESLYQDSRARLTQQAFLLTGHRQRAEHCVRRAFELAWNHWDEVAADVSPEGWVRAAAFDLALSPWHAARLRRGTDHDGGLSGRDQQFLAALQRLPRAQRQAVVLHDALGLTWEQTALEVESSTPAAYGRVVRGRLALARQVPEVTGPDARKAGFGRRLGPLLRGLAARGCPDQGEALPPDRVRRLARLREQGLNTASGIATVGVLGGVAAGLILGTPWHPATPPFITYTHAGTAGAGAGGGGDAGAGSAADTGTASGGAGAAARGGSAGAVHGGAGAGGAAGKSPGTGAAAGSAAAGGKKGQAQAQGQTETQVATKKAQPAGQGQATSTDADAEGLPAALRGPDRPAPAPAPVAGHGPTTVPSPPAAPPLSSLLTDRQVRPAAKPAAPHRATDFCVALLGHPCH
ncbi:sigma factor-like helix-turn-helix DNA-binding protein [Streptacidiphilus cavernicola]|uniref:Sigma factor-like helix-turn-helix DNA-binding protein n=1 Tax=Streptacidiphilus cavernicola TaxID=3342716 RepID=A0ABV6VTI7_9ACTN